MRAIGYTTGVFDMFHIGHLNILRRAKQQCDLLIVGVTTDEIVLKRKNKLPIIPLRERLEIVGSIKYVDKVVVQDSMDKMEAWRQYHFNKMFVGDDWRGTEVWNKLEEEFAAHGVEIVYFPYTNHTSSSILREVIEKFLAYEQNTKISSNK